MRMAAFIAGGLWLGTMLVRAQPAVSPAVTLEVATDRKFYRERAASDVFVQARITATGPAAPAVAGAPATAGGNGGVGAAVRNVALVLDRSGSMAEEPIRALRAAVLAAVAQLAPEDVVSVVAFGSEIETVLEARRRDQVSNLAERVGQLEPAGGAALYDAVNQGAAQVRRQATATSFNQIILVTDGPPTKGPREAEDFTKLAEALAREGIVLSTIGLGAEFNEDMLATMAQIGRGRFRYCAQPGELAEALRLELAGRPRVLGHDAVLTVEFRHDARKLRAFDWNLPAIAGATVTYQFPRLLADAPLTVLASAQVDGFATRFSLPDFATVRLRWKDAASGETRELSRLVGLQFSADGRDVRESANGDVVLTMVDATVREGLEKAIAQLDKANPRGAARALRTSRTEARDLNFELDDMRVEDRIRVLDAYLAETQAGTLGKPERKFMRSGLGGRFETPSPIVEARE